MNSNKSSVVFAAVVLGSCGSRSEPEQAVEESPVESRASIVRREQQLADEQLVHEQVVRELHTRVQNPAEYDRRRAIERLHVNSQVLLVIPKDEVSLTTVRADGLLQRKLALEVVTVFVGEQPDPVVHTYEIIAPRREFMIEGFGHYRFEQQAFMSREPKAQVVELWPCLEEDGQERLVMFKAYVPSASQLRELTEDTKKYTSQRSSRPHGCNLGNS